MKGIFLRLVLIYVHESAESLCKSEVIAYIIVYDAHILIVEIMIIVTNDYASITVFLKKVVQSGSL